MGLSVIIISSIAIILLCIQIISSKGILLKIMGVGMLIYLLFGLAFNKSPEARQASFLGATGLALIAGATLWFNTRYKKT